MVMSYGSSLCNENVKSENLKKRRKP